jgi:hypothetical protein
MSDKSKFVEMSIDYENANLIYNTDREKLETIYKDSNEGTQKAMDKYPERVLDQYTPNARNLESLKNNIQFMAWVLIINLVCIIFYFWYMSI